ncbi:MAG: hypothetical protein NTV59_07945 [Chloroflexi bacterium]|jgi:hypothetical protein|nr:hypothetical protein [Chloroflexota bacterium]
MVSLQDWLNERRLKTHKTSKKEINQLLAVFERDVADAQAETLSADRRFSTAYNAALMVSIAALAASGYRASSEGHHYWTIQSLAFTLQLDAKTIRKFNKFRQKRNISDYERIGMVSEQEVGEMITLAQELHTMVVEWLKKNYPELIQE